MEREIYYRLIRFYSTGDEDDSDEESVGESDDTGESLGIKRSSDISIFNCPLGWIKK
jgi:hypothetical protein